MTESAAIIRHLLEDVPAVNEAEEPDYFETDRELRPNTAARVQADYDHYFGAREGDVSYGSGSRTYSRVGGKWTERTRRRNPAYWDQPNYFIIYPGPGDHAFIVVKNPRRLIQKNFRKALYPIYKDATGRSGYEDQIGVDGTDKEIFDKCLSGKRPELVYEIFIDGTWKRLK